MIVRYVTSFPDVTNLDDYALMDTLENGIKAKLQRGIDRNVLCYDIDSPVGELSHRLMEIASDNNGSCLEIASIEVGNLLTKAFLDDDAFLAPDKKNIALFTFEDGSVMLGAY